MNSKILFALMTIGLSVPVSAYSQQTQEIKECMKPYTPNRLEWLALESNAICRTDMLDAEGYYLAFIPIEKDGAILIYVKYTKNTNRAAMNIGIDSARKVLQINAKSRGWDSWLQIKEQIDLQPDSPISAPQ